MAKSVFIQLSSVQSSLPATYPPWLALGFRPFYLLAAMWMVVSVPIWLLMFGHGSVPGSHLQSVNWHSHEMVFGFTAAVIVGFLFTAVKNRCLNHIKKAKLDIADLGENAVIPDLSVTAQAQLEAKETAAKLNFLIDQLPNKCKQIFLMSRMHELSYKEIADVMEITPKTVENQISIALKFLKENFSKNA